MIRAIGTLENVAVMSDHNINYVTGVICVPRQSGTVDKLPFRCKESIFVGGVGDKVLIEGTLRTYSTPEQIKRTSTEIFVSQINSLSDDEYDMFCNSVNNEFSQVVSVDSISELRNTPAGRTLVDVSLVLTRNNGYTDHISAMVWGSAANAFTKSVKVGDSINVIGRLQSREYHKTIGDEYFTCTNIELSIKSWKLEDVQ